MPTALETSRLFRKGLFRNGSTRTTSAALGTYRPPTPFVPGSVTPLGFAAKFAQVLADAPRRRAAAALEQKIIDDQRTEAALRIAKLQRDVNQPLYAYTPPGEGAQTVYLPANEYALRVHGDQPPQATPLPETTLTEPIGRFGAGTKHTSPEISAETARLNREAANNRASAREKRLSEKDKDMRDSRNRYNQAKAALAQLDAGEQQYVDEKLQGFNQVIQQQVPHLGGGGHFWSQPRDIEQAPVDTTNVAQVALPAAKLTPREANAQARSFFGATSDLSMQSAQHQKTLQGLIKQITDQFVLRRKNEYRQMHAAERKRLENVIQSEALYQQQNGFQPGAPDAGDTVNSLLQGTEEY